MFNQPDFGADRPPILEKIVWKLPQNADHDECVARKHNCMSVWCPSCYARFYLKTHFARLCEMPWDESRLVTLTFDRERVGIGADAYLFAREKKVIGRFIQNLKRLDVEIQDWAGQMEFHKDGAPHWHLLIRTKKGKAGMIGQALLHKAWPWGRMLKEDYFKSEQHYDNTVGYFGKAGYFHKGKKYQTELPDYFKTDYFRGKRIQRFYSARHSSGLQAEPDQNPNEKEPEPSQTISGRKIESCGQFTLLFHRKKYDESGIFTGNDWLWFGELPIPYKDFRNKCPGEYVPGQGYVFNLSGAPPELCPF